MSQHPNVIVKCTVKPDGATRKLLRDLLARNREEIPDDNLPFMFDIHGEVIINRRKEKIRQIRDEDQLAIGSLIYHTLVMEDDYNESWQISGQEGDLIIFNLVTYGYGEEIDWDKLQIIVSEIDQWAGKNSLVYRLSVTANYW